MENKSKKPKGENETAEVKNRKEQILPIEKEQEMIKMDIPVLKSPKVVGKIDLDAINTKLKPKRKTREEKLKERTERSRIKKENPIEQSNPLDIQKQEPNNPLNDTQTEQSIEPKSYIRKKLNKIIRLFFSKSQIINK